MRGVGEEGVLGVFGEVIFNRSWNGEEEIAMLRSGEEYGEQLVQRS